MEHQAYLGLIDKIDGLKDTVLKVVAELKEAQKPYLSTPEVCELLNVSENWVLLHKDELGSSKKTGKLLFKRKDVEDFIDDGYFKITSKKGYT